MKKQVELTIKKVEMLAGSNGKAIIKTMSNGSRVLQSYYTDVVEITRGGKIKVLWDGYSATTARHIKSFCGLNKKELERLAGHKLDKTFDYWDYLNSSESYELKKDLREMCWA